MLIFNNAIFICLLKFRKHIFRYKTIVEEKAIHRDIKPENILYKDDKLKIADFGLSKINTAISENQQQVTVLGTTKYMAPEFLTESTKIELEEPHKIDIWSFGLIFYELLFKTLPWSYGDN